MTPGAADGPVAVITGAASGIGAACAGLMRRSGWRTAGIDLNPSDTDLPVQADVSDRATVAGAVDQVTGRFGRIDLLVTAAGYYEEGIDVTDITVAQWDRMLSVILGGTVNCCAAVLPHMLGRGGLPGRAGVGRGHRAGASAQRRRDPDTGLSPHDSTNGRWHV